MSQQTGIEALALVPARSVGFISTVVLPTSFSFVEKTSDSVYLRDFFAYLKSKKAKNKSEKKEH